MAMKNLVAKAIFIHLASRSLALKEKKSLWSQKVPFYDEFILERTSSRLYLVFVPQENDRKLYN